MQTTQTESNMTYVKPASQRWEGELKVIEIIDETPTVKTFRLGVVNGGKLPFTFLPGQFLQLHWQVDGKDVKRSYTIASSPTQTDYVDLTIKREELGLVTRPMCDQTKVGDRWSVM